MSMRRTLRPGVLLIFCLAAAVSVRAQTVWVSDQFEINLRTGPSTSNAIRLVVPSGTPLEVLERDQELGYARVRTGGGTEGWVLSRYLMNEPPAREQLEELMSRLNTATERGSSVTSQLQALTRQHEEATSRINTLEREKQGLEQELAEIKSTAANALALDRQNKDLRQQLTDAEIKVSILEQENEELTGQKTRNWFLAGALVLLAGIVLGIWLPRIRWQRRSRYERF